MASPESRVRTRWILAALLAAIALARLPGLDAPLIGVHHYRMNQTASIARNYHEQSMNFFLPRIDWGGSGSGIVEEGFQAYAYLVALLYHVFGVSVAVGRGLSVALFTASAGVVYLLARRLHGARAALWAVGFFGVAPMGLYYGRGFQPDPLLVLCSLLSLYWMLVWREDDRDRALWASAAAVALAALIKPLSLYLGLPLLYLCHARHGWALLKQARLWGYAALAVVPTILWYAWAHRLWLEHGNTAGIWGQGFSMVGGVELWTDPELYRLLASYFALHVTTLPGLLLLAVGLFARSERGRCVVPVWGLGFLVALMLSAGVQQWHEYYQLPMVGAAAILMGRGVDRWLDPGSELRRRIRSPLLARALLAGLLLLMARGVYTPVRWEYGRVPDRAWQQLAFSHRLEELTPPGSLVILGAPDREAGAIYRHVEPDGFGSKDDPVEFYNSHRKGWSIVFDADSIEVVEALRRKGATHFTTREVRALARTPAFLAALEERFEPLESTEQWVVYLLSAPDDREP